MICTSIANKTYEQILDILQDPQVELAEIRLDSCPLSDGEIEDLFSQTDTPLIATCRIDALREKGLPVAAGNDERKADGNDGAVIPDPDRGSFGIDAEADEAEAERRLAIAIGAGARFADLELEASVGLSKRFRSLCEESGTEIIRSFHDFSGTPDLEYLKMVTARCFRYGADIAKVVTTCRTPADVQTILSLYSSAPIPSEHPEQKATRPFQVGQKSAYLEQNRPKTFQVGQNPAHLEHPAAEPFRLIAFGMGEAGRQTRLECLKLGAPFSYACFSEDEATAPGQMTTAEMFRKVYAGLPAPGGFYRNSLQVPASKSFAQRAIIAAALADGRSHLRRYTPCSDSEAAIAAAKALGARITRNGTTLTIDGISAGNPLHLETIHAGESGLLTRLLIPLLAVLNDGPVTVTGEKTLANRPLKGISDIMASFGVIVKENKVPIHISGNIIPGTAEISGKNGSQLISGLLAALPLCAKPSTLLISEPKSIPYMFITCEVLKKFGIRISSEMEGDEAMIEQQDWSGCTGITFKIKGGQHYHAADIDLEGDWSSAAAFLVAGAIFGKAEVEGLETESIQADLAIGDIIVQAGAVVSELDEAVCVSKAPLEGFEADLSNAPDLFPVVSVLAAFCAGESRIDGMGRLVGKESNRAEAILQMLTQMGVDARSEADTLVVHGESLASRLMNGRLLKGGAYTARGDHRMAMALKIASLGADSPITVDDTACVAKSFPDFYDSFD